MISSRQLALGLAALVTAGAVTAIGYRARHAAPPPTTTVATVDAGTRAPGHQRRWTLAFEARIEESGHAAPVQVRLAGDWVATISAVRGDEYDVAYEVEGARVGGAGSESASPEDVRALQRRLARRFWVTYRNDGTALRIHFSRDSDPSDRNLVQMIVTETQLVRSANDSPHWTALERDGAGLYLASYQRVGRDQISKRKLRYIEIDGSTGGAAPGAMQVAIDDSERRYTLDSDGEITTFEGGDTLRVGMPSGSGGMLGIRATTHLDNPRTSLAPDIAGSLERASNEVVATPLRTHQVDPEVAAELRDRQLLEGRTTESLLAASTTDDPLLSSRLEALFRRRPESITLAVARVRASNGMRLVTNALGAANTAPAVAALDGLARDHGAPAPMRVDALSGMALCQRPTPEAMRAPLALLDDQEATVRNAARLVAGALARAGRSAHPDEATEIDRTLLSKYASATSIDARVELLSAIGNSAGPTTQPVLEGALRDADATVRATAARSLRLFEGADVDRLLAAKITDDADARVRSAAIFAATFRTIDAFVEALVRAARSDVAESVRADAVSLLRRHQDASPDVPTTLAWVAEHDPRPGVRRIALEALAREER